jgi:ferritin-like metal-binding protein YciE
VANEQLIEKLTDYLQDVHSLEQNAIQMLNTGIDQAGDPQLKQAFREHLQETEQHEQLVRECLERYEDSPSKLKDIAQKGGAVLSGALAKGAPDTTGKLAIQAYAFEHTEIASYRMLRTTALEAGDQQTAQVAERILGQEEAAAEKISGLLEEVARHDLHEMGAAA